MVFLRSAMIIKNIGQNLPYQAGQKKILKKKIKKKIYISESPGSNPDTPLYQSYNLTPLPTELAGSPKKKNLKKKN